MKNNKYLKNYALLLLFFSGAKAFAEDLTPEPENNNSTESISVENDMNRENEVNKNSINVEDKDYTLSPDLINLSGKKTIGLLGKPASGKDTFASMLADFNGELAASGKLQYHIVGFGDELRKLSEKEGYEYLKDLLSEGKLIEKSLMTKLFPCIMANTFFNQELKGSFILNGMPRNMDNIDLFESFAPIQALIYLDISDEMVMQRYGYRASADGNKRVDDNDNTFSVRLNEFRKNTLPAIAEMQSRSDVYFIHVIQREIIEDRADSMKAMQKASKIVNEIYQSHLSQESTLENDGVIVCLDKTARDEILNKHPNLPINRVMSSVSNGVAVNIYVFNHQKTTIDN